MNQMQRFEVINAGFKPTNYDDPRLTFDGADFNDYAFGHGWNEAEAMQFAVELIEASGVKPSKELLEGVAKASTKQKGDEAFTLAIRYFYDKTAENAEFEKNLAEAIERKKQERAQQAEEDFPDPDALTFPGHLAA